MKKLKQVLGGKSSTTKEADHIKIPSFPQPESYRNWKIRVRVALRAASSKPDKAFSWINKVWVEGQTIEGLASPEGFTTLDSMQSFSLPYHRLLQVNLRARLTLSRRRSPRRIVPSVGDRCHS